MPVNKNADAAILDKNKKSGFFYGYVVVICSFIILAISFGINYSFGVFYNPLLADLGWSRAATSVGYSLAQFVGGIMGIVAGRLSDSYGPRPVALACGILLAAGCFLMSRVTDIWQLYLFYGLFIGAGYGGAIISLSSTVSRWFIRLRGLMTGIVYAGIGFGTMVMPLVSNHLLAVYNWRNSFIILGAAVLIIVTVAAFFLKRDPSKTGQIPYGAVESSNPDTIVFDPGMVWQKAIRDGSFWVFFLICLLFGYFVQSVIVHIVPHAREMGIEAGQAASIISFLGIGSILGRVIMGSASDRIGIRYTLLIALGMMLATLAGLQIAGTFWMFYLFALIFGFAYGTLIAMQTLAPARMFGLASLGTLVGIITFAYTSGGAIGPIITGYIFDVTDSYRWAFIVCAILAAGGLALAAALKITLREGR